MVCGLGSVLGGADEVVMHAVWRRGALCSERGERANPLLHRLKQRSDILILFQPLRICASLEIFGKHGD